MSDFSHRMRRAWKTPEAWILAALLLMVSGELLASQLGHRTQAELLAALDSTSAFEQIEALHSLSNRDNGEVISRALVQKLLQSEWGAVREYAMTSDFTRLLGRDLQQANLARLRDSNQTDEAYRHWLMLNRGVGKRPTLSRVDIKKYFEKLGAE